MVKVGRIAGDLGILAKIHKAAIADDDSLTLKTALKRLERDMMVSDIGRH